MIDVGAGILTAKDHLLHTDIDLSRAKTRAFQVTHSQLEKPEDELRSLEVKHGCLNCTVKDIFIPCDAHSWVTESGITRHITYDRSLFLKYDSVSDVGVEVGTKDKVVVAGRGDIFIEIPNKKGTSVLELEKVPHLPSLEYCILSVGAIYRVGVQIKFKNGSFQNIQNSWLLAAKAFLRGSLYIIDARNVIQSADRALVASLRR